MSIIETAARREPIIGQRDDREDTVSIIETAAWREPIMGQMVKVEGMQQYRSHALGLRAVG
jgi:hypothetical protein